MRAIIFASNIILMDYQFAITGTIGQGYDWWTGTTGTTSKGVAAFLKANKDKEVDIAVSSPGGFVDSGLEIYQLIRDHGMVNIHIIGMTASAATFLCMGAKSVDMADGSLMLIHNASQTVDVYESANKENLDRIIQSFQKTRDDLDTIDKVIASIYAKRCKKSCEEVMRKMTKAAWLSPSDALEFGLIDAIRSDDEIKDKLNAQRQQFSNSINKEFGLPPFPAMTANVKSVGEEPTRSILQKTVDAVKSAFSKQPAQKSNDMIQIFTNVMALLGIKEGFTTNDDGTICLTQQQVNVIDNQMGVLAKQAATDKEATETLRQQLDKANADLVDALAKLKTANETIDCIKNKQGDDTKNKPDDNAAANAVDSAAELYNRIKNI